MTSTTILLAAFNADERPAWMRIVSTFPAFRRPLPLRFIESDDTYSVYEDRDGEEVYLAHGTGLRLLSLDEIDLSDWKRHCVFNHVGRGMMLDLLKEHTLYPHEVDELDFCGDCGDLEYLDDLYVTGGGDHRVCDSCREAYSTCGDCDDLERHGQWVEAYDTWVCDHCRSSNWFHCEDCDGLYRDSDNWEHEHDDNDPDCNCDPLRTTFRVRNGEEMLANDTSVILSLPKGIISEEGMGAIAQHLRDAYLYQSDIYGAVYGLSLRLSEIGNEWQGKRGNFTKRLSSFAYKEVGLKITPDVLTQIGNLARQHSNGIEVNLEVTRQLNMDREEFWHDSSCWWTEYNESRCALKTNGGYGLRTFGTHSYTYHGQSEPTIITRTVEGRAWVMPMRDNGDRLVPTFNATTADAFIVFNGYGDLEGYTPARIVALMNGMTYRKIAFSCSPMYVNGDSSGTSSGYLVSTQEVIARYEDAPSISLDVEQHSNLHLHEADHSAAANEMEFANA